MSSQDDTSPVTRSELMQMFADLRNLLNEDVQHALAEQDDRMHEQFVTKEDLVNALKVNNEQLIHDFSGIFKDRTEQHSDKLEDLETRVHGLENQFGRPAVA